MSFLSYADSIPLNLSKLTVLVEEQGKSQKSFDLSSFDWDLNHSNLCNTDGAMNFQNWEIFSGTPSR